MSQKMNTEKEERVYARCESCGEVVYRILGKLHSQDDIDFTKAEDKIPFRDEWPTNSAKIIKLRAHVYLLEQDVRTKLAACNDLMNRYENGSIKAVHVDTPYKVVGESLAYATILDLLHTSMRELGMEYQIEGSIQEDQPRA